VVNGLALNSTSVYGVGAGGLALQANSGGWTQLAPTTTVSSSTILRLQPPTAQMQEATWSPVPSGLVSAQFTSVWGSQTTSDGGPSGDVWFGAASGSPATDTLHWNGVSLGPAQGAPAAYFFNGLGSMSVWALSASGASSSAIQFWNGSTWSATPAFTSPGGVTLKALWASGSNDVWAVGGTNGTPGNAEVYHSVGMTAAPCPGGGSAAWCDVTTEVLGTNSGVHTIVSVGSTSGSDVWMVTTDGDVIHGQGSSSAWVPVTPGTGPVGVVAAKPGEVFFAGGSANGGPIVLLTSTSTDGGLVPGGFVVDVDAPIVSLYAGMTGVWAVGQGGSILFHEN
jgi:hypothetical protein